MLSMISLSREFIDAIRQTHGNELKKIKLSNNGLQCIRNIEHLSPALEKLDLSCNDLSDIQPLSLLTSLVELDLSENRIEDLSPLASLTNLRVLRLDGNRIAKCTSLEPLRNISSLRQLSLQGNGICVESSSSSGGSSDSAAAVYPFNLFQLLPQLEVVDKW